MTERVHETVRVAGLEFLNMTLLQVVDTLIKQITCGVQPIQVCTVNTDILVLSKRDPELRAILETSVMVLADGMPLIWLSRMMGDGLLERVAGSDLVEALIEWGTDVVKVFLLGGGNGVPDEAAVNIRASGTIQVVGAYSPTRAEVDSPELSSAIIDKINASGANLLLVSLGCPRQEKWIYNHMGTLKTKVNIGVGATMDFLALRIPRAPKWMRQAGLEWLYRLSREPRRLWKRYIIRSWGLLPIVLEEIHSKNH